MKPKRTMLLGAGGRVGRQIASEFMRRGLDIVAVDIMDAGLLQQVMARLHNDACLAVGATRSRVAVYGGVNALDEAVVGALLDKERPSLVINYAIPITWDASKRLPNYDRISAAGLGAFTPIQVLTPLAVARAMVAAGIECPYMVGNLPDITIPVITAMARDGSVRRPSVGAGNVGLNQVAMRRQAALELGVSFDAVEVNLVSHHVHWVAPREPGYSQNAPFMAQVMVDGEDVSGSLSSLRELMNRGVKNHYEAGAAFSSTTGILATRVAQALLDESEHEHRLHAPAPNGLPGGYPLRIQNGRVEVALPDHWALQEAVAAMEQCQALDGVESISGDGAVQFTDAAREILRHETGFELPSVMQPGEVEAVAQAQIDTMTALFAR